ncbi:MAG: WbqC family protein [Luminiphilus sp.]|nr:WbqC family protein [Luminiphilus sp.]
MKRVVVSQPMFLPWVGIFQQIRAADVFVHYDDVQFPQGRSFSSRVQIKAEDGSRWLTVPIRRDGKQLIRDVKIDQSKAWKANHLGLLYQAYRKAQFADLAMALVESIYTHDNDSLSEFCMFGIEKITNFLGLKCKFILSSSHSFTSSSSKKLLDIVKAEQGDVYITGHGAKKYLDHELFELSAIDVEYMDYMLRRYSQLHGNFTSYVSIIDLIANTGEQACDYVTAKTINWREFVGESK